MREDQAVDMGAASFQLHPFLAWSHGPAASGQTSGVPVPSGRARVGNATSPCVHIREAREPSGAQGEGGKGKPRVPVA